MGLEFPNKKHWKYPSKKEYICLGLEKFISTYKERGIESIAFPLLGADKGGIPQEESLSLMRHYLDSLSIDVEIYRYSPTAEDDLYKKTKDWLLSKDVEYISQSTGLRRNFVTKVSDAMRSRDIHQLNQLGKVDGIGIKTLEKYSIWHSNR